MSEEKGSETMVGVAAATVPANAAGVAREHRTVVPVGRRPSGLRDMSPGAQFLFRQSRLPLTREIAAELEAEAERYGDELELPRN